MKPGAAGGHVAVAGAVGIIRDPEGEELPGLQMELQSAWLTGQRGEIGAGRPFYLGAGAVQAESSARIGRLTLPQFPRSRPTRTPSVRPAEH